MTGKARGKEEEGGGGDLKSNNWKHRDVNLYDRLIRRNKAR